MLRFIVEVICSFGAFAGGWYCGRKYGTKGDVAVKAVEDAVKPQ